jgi:hypothetical protein
MIGPCSLKRSRNRRWSERLSVTNSSIALEQMGDRPFSNSHSSLCVVIEKQEGLLTGHDLHLFLSPPIFSC